MIKSIIISVLLMTLPISIEAQNIDSIFVNTPETVLPLLEHNSKLDMLDLYNCGMIAMVYNVMGGKSCLMQKDSLQYLVQTTENSRLQMRILPLGRGSKVYSFVRTVFFPEGHSQISFYDEGWNIVKVPLPKEVDFENCWIPSDSLSDDRLEMLRRELAFAHFFMKWDVTTDGSPVLIFEVSVKGLLPELQKDALLCLRPLQYLWRDGKWIVV